MGNLTALAALSVALAMTVAAVILARRSLAASARGAYAIRSGVAISRERRRVQACLWLALFAVTISGGVAVHASVQVDSLSKRLAGLESQLRARTEVQAPLPVAVTEPAPVVTQAELVSARFTPEPATSSASKVVAALDPAAAPGPATWLAVVSMPGRGRLIVRDSPGGQVLGTIANGTRLVVLDRDAYTKDGRRWSRVRATGGSSKGLMQGWAAAEFITEAQTVGGGRGAPTGISGALCA